MAGMQTEITHEVTSLDDARISCVEADHDWARSLYDDRFKCNHCGAVLTFRRLGESARDSLRRLHADKLGKPGVGIMAYQAPDSEDLINDIPRATEDTRE